MNHASSLLLRTQRHTRQQFSRALGELAAIGLDNLHRRGRLRRVAGNDFFGDGHGRDARFLLQPLASEVGRDERERLRAGKVAQNKQGEALFFLVSSNGRICFNRDSFAASGSVCIGMRRS